METSNKRQKLVGIIFSYLTIIVKIISGLIYVPIIIKYLGQSEYGVYSLVISFTGYLTIFSSGMNATYIRFYVRAKTKKDKNISKLNGLFMKIFFVLALISLLIGILIGIFATNIFGEKINENEYQILQNSFYILAISTFFTIINCVFSSLIIANEKYIFGKLVELINTIITPLITIPLVINGFGSICILLVSLFIVCIDIIFNSVYCFNKLNIRFTFEKSNRILLKQIWIFALFIAIQGVMDQLNWQIDKLILARVRGVDEVAIYTVGSTLNNYYIVISAAMCSVFIAEINQLVTLKKDKKISNLFVKTSRFFGEIVFFVMSAYCIFGKAFIQVWVGEGFEKSYYIGLLIMLPVTVSLTQGLGLDIVRAKNLHHLQIVINIIVCILNAIVSIPLAIYFGAIGSAIGTFVSEIIICVVIQGVYYQKVVKLDMRAYIAEMFHLLPGLVFPICYGIFINALGFLRPSVVSLSILGLIYFIIYLVSMWLFGMRDEEKNAIRKIISKSIYLLKR